MIIGLMDIKVETSPKDKESSPRGSYKRKRRQRTSIKQPQAEEISESDVSENDLCEDESHAKVSKGEEGDLVILQHEVLSKPSEIIIESASNEPQANVNSRLAEYPQVLNEADDSSCSLPGPSTRYPRPVCKLSPSAAFKANLRQMRIEKIQHSTGGLSGRKMWSEEETKTLVDVWDEESAGIWRSSSKKMISLQRISDILQQRNVDRDVSQVEGKIKALKRDFKAVKANKAIPSVQARMAPYLDKLESIFLREEL
ncbi:uncharacterized protein LOC128398177 [Panonychus citri]|nr:uncharacterized protein LOC128398177 [Panonychus citri]